MEIFPMFVYFYFYFFLQKHLKDRNTCKEIPNLIKIHPATHLNFPFIFKSVYSKKLK